jgi:hypothetical protein
MLSTYFEIIRFALNQNRKKKDGIYYESHHIIPRSFGKNSTTVLLTPEEHYRAHRCLAEAFSNHSIYGQKMLWTFHRMTYNNGRAISEKEYADARELLMPLWKRNKSESFKEKMKVKMKGNKNGIGGKDNWTPTEEQRKNYSKAATIRQLGQCGENSRASKGAVIYETIDGKKIEAGSAHLLSKIIGIKTSTMIYRMKHKEGQMINGYKVYYK